MRGNNKANTIKIIIPHSSLKERALTKRMFEAQHILYIHKIEIIFMY